MFDHLEVILNFLVQEDFEHDDKIRITVGCLYYLLLLQQPNKLVLMLLRKAMVRLPVVMYKALLANKSFTPIICLIAKYHPVMPIKWVRCIILPKLIERSFCYFQLLDMYEALETKKDITLVLKYALLQASESQEKLQRFCDFVALNCLEEFLCLQHNATTTQTMTKARRMLGLATFQIANFGPPLSLAFPAMFYDLTIYCRNGQFCLAHRIVLYNQSSYVRGMISWDPELSNIFLDFDLEVVEQALRFVYNNDTPIYWGQSCCLELLRLAKFLGMDLFLQVIEISLCKVPSFSLELESLVFELGGFPLLRRHMRIVARKLFLIHTKSFHDQLEMDLEINLLEYSCDCCNEAHVVHGLQVQTYPGRL
jgi:hypothetical protein